MKQFALKSAAFAACAIAIAASASTPALAGPIYTFATSTGIQPSNAGVITLTQNGANAVDVNVDLINPTYGFVNTGGKHTPFAFTLAGSEVGLSIAFTTPVGGTYIKNSVTNILSLNTAGGENTPFGVFGVAIDSTAGNGSDKGYYGDLLFTLTRTGGLSTDDFIANDDGAFFSADLSNGSDTGAQAWMNRSGTTITTLATETVPEPFTASLFGAGLAGAAVLRRRKAKRA
jgi:hypothetical protein